MAQDPEQSVSQISRATELRWRIELLGPHPKLLCRNDEITIAPRLWAPLALLAIWQLIDKDSNITAERLQEELYPSFKMDHRLAYKYMHELRAYAGLVKTVKKRFELALCGLDLAEFMLPIDEKDPNMAGFLAAQRRLLVRDPEFRALRDLTNASPRLRDVNDTARRADETLCRLIYSALEAPEEKATAVVSFSEAKSVISRHDADGLLRRLWDGVEASRLKTLTPENLVGAVERIDRRLAIERGKRLSELQPHDARLHHANNSRMACIQGDQTLAREELAKIVPEPGLDDSPVTHICFRLATVGIFLSEGPRVGDLAAIFAHLESALLIARENGEIKWEIECLWAEATACWRAHVDEGDDLIVRAESAAEAGLALAKNYGDAWWISRLHDRLATIHFSYDPKKTNAHIDSAASSGFGQPTDLLGLARFKLNAGWTAYEQKSSKQDLPRGITLSEEGLWLSRLISMRTFILDGINNLALMHLDSYSAVRSSEDLESARTYLFESTGMAVESPALRHVAKLFELWGFYFSVLEKPVDSVAAFLRAQDAWKGLPGSMHEEFQALYDQEQAKLSANFCAQLRAEQGDSLEIEAAIDLLQAWLNAAHE